MSRRKRPSRPRSRPSKRGDRDGVLCTLRIERLASGGEGVAVRDDGKTVFVEDTAPGDLVRARIVDERRRYARARSVELLEPGPDRVSPRCEHFGACGGCTWQHLDYAAQVAAKARILRDALERVGGVALDADPPMTASREAYGYRGRARVRVRSDAVGFLERGSHRLCAIEACPVLAPSLEAAVLDLPALAEAEANGSEQEWSVCIGTDGAASCVDTARPGRDMPGATASIALDVAGTRIGLDARVFSQANVTLYDALVERVTCALFDGVGDLDARSWRVLEIHAGVGFFTRALADRVHAVVAIEADPRAVAWLERNVAETQGRVEVIGASFEQAARRVAGGRFDAVLLDPPRTGLSPAELDALGTLAPRRIVYLSCDPATLARDVRGLGEHAGYRVDHVEGLDLFPQTPHTEGLVRLVRDEEDPTSSA